MGANNTALPPGPGVLTAMLGLQDFNVEEERVYAAATAGIKQSLVLRLKIADSLAKLETHFCLSFFTLSQLPCSNLSARL